MKKIIVLIALSFLFMGCTKSNQQKSFTLDFFYVDTCHNCENFKLIAIPRLKNEFSNMQVNYHNLDEDHDLYDAYVKRIIDFDQEEYESVPCIIINNELVIVGYSEGEELELIKEINRYFNHEKLGQYYVIGEYKLKQ